MLLLGEITPLIVPSLPLLWPHSNRQVSQALNRRWTQLWVQVWPSVAGTRHWQYTTLEVRDQKDKMVQGQRDFVQVWSRDLESRHRTFYASDFWEGVRGIMNQQKVGSGWRQVWKLIERQSQAINGRSFTSG